MLYVHLRSFFTTLSVFDSGLRPVVFILNLFVHHSLLYGLFYAYKCQAHPTAFVLTVCDLEAPNVISVSIPLLQGSLHLSISSSCGWPSPYFLGMVHLGLDI